MSKRISFAAATPDAAISETLHDDAGERVVDT
jgi:hypothetical protein